MESDRISDLPSDILDKISSNLPIVDRVKTTVLSSQWKYKLAMFPDLVFDDDCFWTKNHKTFARTVDHVLLLHKGPIRKFKLSRRQHLSTRDIDRWVIYISKNSIKELILDIWKGNRYKIPSILFSCQDLVHLELLECLLKPPPEFKGFMSLKSIDIENVTIPQDVFNNLITFSTLLERLSVKNCEGFTHLKIVSSSLRQFTAVGSVFEAFSFEKTLYLNTVYIDFGVKFEKTKDHIDAEQQIDIEDGSSSNLVKFFQCLPHIRSLDTQSKFLKYLAANDVPRELPKLCLSLTFLTLRVGLNNSDQIRALLCLLRSAPVLQELHILCHREYEFEDVNAHGTTNSSLFDVDNLLKSEFPKLRLIKITDVTSGTIEAALGVFVEFMLLSSPELKSMSIDLAPSKNRRKITASLLPYGSLSKRAKTFHLDLFPKNNIVVNCEE